MATETANDTNTSRDAVIEPGDVRINSVVLKTEAQELDITNYVLEVNVYEDIFSNVLTGTIAVRDTINLIDLLPIVGNELVSIDINTPAAEVSPGDVNSLAKIQKSFAVYAIKNRILTNQDKEQMYLLHFISLEGAVDNITYLSQKFDGKTDELVEKIFDEHIKMPRYLPLGENSTDDEENKSALIIGDTPHSSSVSFVAPFWTPFQCLNYIAQRSVGANNKAPTFLFFETLHGFYFTSLENLIDAQFTAGSFGGSYIYMDQTATERNTAAGLIKKYGKVEEVKFLTNLDMLQGQDTGHYTSSTFVYDMVKKEVKQTIYDHGIQADLYAHLEDYVKGEDGKYTRDKEGTTSRGYQNTIFPATIMRSYNSKMFIKTIHPGVTDNDDGELMNLRPDEFTANRNSLFLDVNTLKLSIKVPGQTHMHVGKIIEFKYPSVRPKSTSMTIEEFYDKHVSGFYLVTAIHHQITTKRHTMIMEIAKDSFVSPTVAPSPVGENTQPQQSGGE
jgi:hypothetical protein